jgi:small subunit ribosomal protein S21
LVPEIGIKGGLSLTQVQVKPNETLDQALKRFKKQIQQTGILREAREHYEYQKPSDRKRKAIAAAKRKQRLKSTTTNE